MHIGFLPGVLLLGGAMPGGSQKGSRASSRESKGESEHASSQDDESLMRLFASYSPAEVVLRYDAEAAPTVPQQPEREDFDAAIGFVDVSGFTALSEKLAKDYGRKGAELLNQCASSPARLGPRSPPASEPSAEPRAPRRRAPRSPHPAAAPPGTSTHTSSSSSMASIFTAATSSNLPAMRCRCEPSRRGGDAGARSQPSPAASCRLRAARWRIGCGGHQRGCGRRPARVPCGVPLRG